MALSDSISTERSATPARAASMSISRSIVAARGLGPLKSSASRSENIVSLFMSAPSATARIEEGDEPSITTSAAPSCDLRIRSLRPSSPPSARSDQSPRIAPSAMASTRTTLSFDSSSAAAMSSAALSGRAAAMTIRPEAVSHTVSHETAMGSSG